MSMFYYDNRVRLFEKDRKILDLIKYLETKLNSEYSAKLHATLLLYSWYFYIEGPSELKDFSEFQLEFFKYNWIKYINMVDFQSDYFVQFYAGYTLLLDGFFINKDSYKKGKLLLQNCCKNSDDNIKILSFYFLDPNKNKKKLRTIDENSLFDSESLLDVYFKNLIKISK